MTRAHRYCHAAVGAALSHSAVVSPPYLSHLCPGQLCHPDSHKTATQPQRPYLCSREKERDFLVSLVFSPLSEKNEKV